MASKKPPAPKSPKAWDIRPRATKGAGTADELYLAVGMALSAWELAENALADIFTLFVGAPEISPPRVPAIRAYGAILGFGSRADMLDAAADGFFNFRPRGLKKDSPIVAKWKQGLCAEFDGLLKEARGFASRRNEIAHGIVSGSGRLGHFLYPPLYNAKKHPISDGLTVHEAAAFCYSADDVRYYRDQFRGLMDRLHDLADQLRHLPKS